MIPVGKTPEQYIEMLEIQIEVLQGENAALRAKVVYREGVPDCFGLIASEACILGMLIVRESASREQLLTALPTKKHYYGPDSNVINVHVCRIRKKLEPFGVEIDRLWGFGYRLTPENKKKIAALCTPAPVAELLQA